MNLLKTFNYKKVLDFNLEQTIKDVWKAIPPCSKKSFYWMFAIINVVFLWHTVTFYFGNHDWGQIKNGVPVWWSVFDGRWGAGLLQQLVGGDLLPVLNNVFCFAGFCFAMIALAKYWNIPRTTLTYTVFGLFIMLMPYTYPWLQFLRSETHFWNMLIIIIGLMLADSKKIYWQLLSVPLFTFSLGCYAAMIEGIVSIFLCKCLLDVWFEYKNFKNFMKKHYRPVIYIAISFVIFALIHFLFWERVNAIMAISTTRVSQFDDILENIKHLPETIMATFFTSTPFMPTFFKAFMLLAFPIILPFFFKKSIRESALIFVIVAALVLSTQLIQIISVDPFYNQQRIDFFCMPYVYAVGWSILLRQKKNLWKSIAMFMMICATYYSGLQAFRCQKIKYFDLQQEMRVYDDVFARIKSNPNFSPDKQYSLLILGSTMDKRIYTNLKYLQNEIPWYNAWTPYVPNWNAKDFFDFYETKSYIKVSYSPIAQNPLPDDYLMTMDLDYLMSKAAPWPNQNSVHVDDQNIYIIFSQEELDELRNRIISLMNSGH